MVEGRNDTVAVQRAVDADTIETRGSAIGDHVLAEIRRAQQKRGVIVFTDPDQAGERIRRIISKEISGVKHAFLSQKEARGKHKIGVEHASPTSIIQALAQVRSESKEEAPPLTWEDYVDLGFVGSPNSASYRQQIADVLQIGYGNAKQFYRRLHVLRISQEELIKAMEKVGKETADES
ncbi:RNAse M5 [Hazenella coriacea]|uniref:Ribonuclease M5 n=1 Tax=Hazenella coriacea TaxID=1179467 RepID=A0A4R3L5K5_9BACL|nr:RNAse M5 [Hazenella coriacea]